jgi:hypothetical protein
MIFHHYAIVHDTRLQPIIPSVMSSAITRVVSAAVSGHYKLFNISTNVGDIIPRTAICV